MRIATITTLRHNIGDDFAREGILFLLAQLLGEAEFEHVHKHLPISARRGALVPGLLRRLPERMALRAALAVDDLLPLSPRDIIAGADLVVQCGAPIFWKNAGQSCWQAEWVGPLFRRRVEGRRRKFLNIGGGTCQGYHSDGSEVWQDPRTAEFIRWLSDLARLTIVRDTLSARILEAVGRPARLLPCPSLFARDRWGVGPAEPEYVVLNVMPLGGHYDLEGNLDPARWLETCRKVVPLLRDRYPCRIVCHNRRELDVAARLFPDIPRFHAENFADYLPFFARARFGILNRVHAGFAMASFGRPSLVIGTDSRAHMLEHLGLQHRFLNDVGVADILAAAEQLDAALPQFGAAMEDLRERTRLAYLQALGPALA